MAEVHKREGAQVAAPPFYSEVSKPITDAAKIREIVGAGVYTMHEEEAGNRLQLDHMHPVLTFNAADCAILQFFDHLTIPDGLSEADKAEWAPRQWRKKLPDDGGVMRQKAAQLMKWSE